MWIHERLGVEYLAKLRRCNVPQPRHQTRYKDRVRVLWRGFRRRSLAPYLTVPFFQGPLRPRSPISALKQRNRYALSLEKCSDELPIFCNKSASIERR